MNYFTYILTSEVNRQYYIGQTNNLENRLKKHNLGQNKSTKSKRPWKLLWYIEFDTRAEAMQFEKKLKNKKSRKILEKIMSTIGHWHRA